MSPSETVTKPLLNGDHYSEYTCISNIFYTVALLLVSSYCTYGYRSNSPRVYKVIKLVSRDPHHGSYPRTQPCDTTKQSGYGALIPHISYSSNVGEDRLETKEQS